MKNHSPGRAATYLPTYQRLAALTEENNQISHLLRRMKDRFPSSQEETEADIE